MKKIVATFMSIVMMLAILVPSALAQTESQFYDQWYEDTSWKLAKCYYNWNSTGCLGCAGINEEFITAYEYYKSVYPNSKYCPAVDFPLPLDPVRNILEGSTPG